MLRPKSDRFVGVKMPEALYLDISAQAARETRAVRLRDLTASEKTVSDVIKDCCEFRMTFVLGLHLGYYRLREVRFGCEEESGFTDGQKV